MYVLQIDGKEGEQGKKEVDKREEKRKLSYQRNKYEDKTEI